MLPLFARACPSGDTESCGGARSAFGGKVRSWCTFNEPGVYTFSGYCMGGFPPGRVLALRTAGRVLKHMLIAHADAYRLIKSMPGAGSSVVSRAGRGRAGGWWDLGACYYARHARHCLPAHQGRARCGGGIACQSRVT